jgi:Tripartite tricarboxylate transporter family receptor
LTIPMKAGRPARFDYEYERNGTANLFMMSHQDQIETQDDEHRSVPLWASRVAMLLTEMQCVRKFVNDERRDGLIWIKTQTYPTRPVRIIVGFAAGGPNDILARLTGQWLSERLGQSFVIENRTGAGGNIGTEAVVKAPPDGYTLLLVAASHAINASLYDNLNFNFLHDIAPVGSFARVPNVMEVNPLVPAKTVPEFIAYAKANPGRSVWRRRATDRGQISLASCLR